MACSGSFVLVCGSGFPPPPRFFFRGGVGFLTLRLPSFGRCMHWSVDAVTNWLADRAVGCRCVGRGLWLCPGSVRHAANVHVWAAGPFCLVRIWLFLLGRCASWTFGACGVRGGGGGVAW